MHAQAPELSSDDVRKRSADLKEPDWLSERRIEAARAYEKLPIAASPRTNLTKLDLPRLARLATPDATRATRDAPKREGVLVLPLAEAAREHEDLVRPHLLSATVKPEDGRIEALHASHLTEGTFMYVPRGVELDEPLVADVVVGPEGALAHSLIVAEPTSKVTILERWRSAEGVGESLVTSGVEIVARDGANVHYASVQDLAPTVTHLSVKRARVGRDAFVGWMAADFGAKTTVSVVESMLAEKGASTNNVGAFFGAGRQHMDVTSSARHLAPHTSSVLSAKGVLMDEAYGAYYGLVNIGPDAPDSSGHQKETTLLLSEKARADATPKLDVENNNVSASHSAAVGQVDKDQIFYLRSRGLNEKTATRVLVEGFFEPLLAEIPLEAVREDIRTVITRRLS